MGSRGRQSLEDTLRIVPAPRAIDRPEAPATLTPDQAQEWSVTVDALPADWFGPETWALLESYCRHVASARRYSAMIEAEEASNDLDIVLLDKLGKMRERETRAAASYATRLRITKQATQRADKVINGRGGGKKPWEVV